MPSHTVRRVQIIALRAVKTEEAEIMNIKITVERVKNEQAKSET